MTLFAEEITPDFLYRIFIVFLKIRKGQDNPFDCRKETKLWIFANNFKDRNEN